MKDATKKVAVEAQNGAPANGKMENSTVVKSEPQPLAKVMEEFRKPETVESRFKKAEQFGLLTDRHQLLMEKKADLDKFLISDDGTTPCSLHFKRAGRNFEMSNPGVIKEVLTYAKTKLNSMIEISEAEVLGFKI